MLSPTARSLNSHGRALHLCLRCQRGHRPLPRSSAFSFSTSANHAADVNSDLLTTLGGGKTRDPAPNNVKSRENADLYDRTYRPRPRRRDDERSQSPNRAPNAMGRDPGAGSSRTGNSAQSRTQHQSRSTTSNSNTNWSNKDKSQPSTETPRLQSYYNEPPHPSTRTAVIKFWEPLQNIADAWAVRKYVEEKYGPIIETHFLKDFEMPTTYQLTAYIVFASPKSLELIANEQTSLTGPAPSTGTQPPSSPKTQTGQKPKVKPKGIEFMVPTPSSAHGKAICEIGMEDLEGLVGSGDNQGFGAIPRSTQNTTKQVQTETNGRVIGGTLGVAETEFNNEPRDKRIFQLSSHRNMEAFLRWGGFVPLPALKPVVEPARSSACVRGKTDSTPVPNHPNPLAEARNKDADEPRVETVRGPLKLFFTDPELFPSASIHGSMSMPKPTSAASTSTLASTSTSTPTSTTPAHIEIREARRMRTSLEMCAHLMCYRMPEGVRPPVVRAGEEGEQVKSEDGEVRVGESEEVVKMREKEVKTAGREFAGLYEEGVSPEPLDRLRGTSSPDSQDLDSIDPMNSSTPSTSSTSNPAQPPPLTPEQIAESQELARQMNAARMLSRIRAASVSAAAAANAKARKPRVPVVVESGHGRGRRDLGRSNNESWGEGEEGGKEEKRGILGLIRSLFGR